MYRRRSPQQNPYGGQTYGGGRRRGMGKITLIIALVMAAFYVLRYCSYRQQNDITGETQYISISQEQEIALGLQSAPKMAAQHGGLLDNQEAQDYVDMVGQRIVRKAVLEETGYQFDFHLLADPRVVNAFALPGGQVFITQALFSKLETEDQLAGVLGHEIGHVVGRHGAERIAKQELTQGLTGAAVIAAGDYSTAQAAQMIANLVNMKYGRGQELSSDDLGVKFMMQAGYRPEDMIGVMEILKAASGDNRQPEFFSTHPDPGNRMEEIKNSIDKYRSIGI